VKANQSGRTAENFLADVLRGVGLEFKRQQRVGYSIYHTPIHPWRLRADFIVTNLVKYPSGLAVESKWQDSPGSVDEKFLYLAENIKTRYEVPAIVVVFGGACRPGAFAWLQAQCDGDRLVAVLKLDEFLSWALRSEKRELNPRLFPDELLHV